MEKIDYIIPWVDGNDSSWLSTKNKFKKNSCLPSENDDANDDCRYRADSGLLRYIFRGIEKFAPWFNNIYFVTCGQRPEWMTENHPRLLFINHKDYIPDKYLPTFNSNTIELNFHRIKNLSEHFVLINDDMFLLKAIAPEFFFKNTYPVLVTDLRYPHNIGYNNWSRLLFNDYCVVNNFFQARHAIWEQRKKWFNLSELGIKRARQNFVSYLANKTIPVHYYGHFIQPHLKSTFEEVWRQYPEVMETTCLHKFRADDQVNQWLLCAWNQAKGTFYPANEYHLGKVFSIGPHNIVEVAKIIKTQLYPQICVNDSASNTDYELSQKQLREAFDSILPEKSSFEKY